MKPETFAALAVLAVAIPALLLIGWALDKALDALERRHFHKHVLDEAQARDRARDVMKGWFE